MAASLAGTRDGRGMSMKPSRSNAGRRTAITAVALVVAIPLLLTAAAVAARYVTHGAGAHAASHKASRGRHHRHNGGRSSGSVPPVTISPLPGTPDASPHTQISFLGLPANEITHISVVGSRSGRHSGHLESYDSAPGASFLPNKGFVQGEHVKVTALVGPPDARKRVSSHFKIARLFHFHFPSKRQRTPVQLGEGVRSFESEPNLHPPTVSVTTDSSQATPGDVFFGFNGGHAQWGPTIMDGEGHLIWFHPMQGDNHAMDFKVAEYEGKKVLVWWQGYIPPIGVGFGRDEIYNSHYQKIAEVKAGNGYHADLHEVLITPEGQAYTTAYTLVKANLSPDHGPREGNLQDAILQEIDIKTGLVMFEWHAYGHVGLRESYSHPPNIPNWPFDFFHINSISMDPSGDGNFIISARNTWAGYEIDHRTGNILWRLGGKKSSFKMEKGTQTAYQHDIRWHPDGTLTAFDDGSSPQVHHQSRVIHEEIDWATKTVKLISEDVHNPSLVANSQGNDQLMSNGDSFVGWGSEPYLTEYGPEGKTLFNALLPTPGESYRAYRFQWSGTPSSPPSIAARKEAGGAVSVYASWNGATEVGSWRVLAGTSRNHLEPAGTATSAGFETKIALHTKDTWFAVQPLDSSGQTLATSNAVELK